ncbi:MAG: hypothetical protein AMXMBFR81_02670 [Chthonomonas sp.]|nr:hypothetical protein [Fimbriimonadaceae bacterium]
MKEHSRWARIGLLVAQDDRYGAHYQEAIERTGLAYETLEDRSLMDLSSHGVLLLCGHAQLKHHYVESVAQWVQEGGCVICSGSTWGLESVLGLDPKSQAASTESLNQTTESPIWPEDCDRIRFMGGALHAPNGCEVLASVRDGFVGLGRRRVGRGWAYWLAPHLGQTAALMQAGRSVESDSPGPSDASAYTMDGDLRAEDGTNLSYEHDRATVADEHPYFDSPYVDLLREMWLRAVVQSAKDTGRALAMMWYWPNFSPATVMLTFECTSLDPDQVYAMDRMLQMMQGYATWLTGPPGYGNDIYRWMKQRGHEPGLLFVTEDANGWHEGKLKIQYQVISRSSSSLDMAAIRPMNGRWYRLDEMYTMVEETAAKVSLSKGGRQPGTSGYLFGTCHPYYPIKQNGVSSRILEVPYQICDPGKACQDGTAARLVQQTLMRNGCLQVVSRPEAVAEPVAFSSLRKVLTQCKMNRMEFVLPSEIAEYERLRRNVRLAQIEQNGQPILRISTPTRFEKACLMISEPATDAGKHGMPSHQGVREYLGLRWLSVVLDLDAKSPNDVRVSFGTPDQRAA